MKTINTAKTNPITTILGVLTIAAGLAPIWLPATVATKVQSSAAVVAGAGLIGAADSKKQQR